MREETNIIEILKTADKERDFHSAQNPEMLSGLSEEDLARWSDVEDSEDEQDELQLSFREGMKRTASEEFCTDLKRIKFDNNVREVTHNLSSFQMNLMETSSDKPLLKDRNYKRTVFRQQNKSKNVTKG